SEIMKIVLIGENPQDVADIINAVQAAYMKEVVLVDQLKKKSTLDTLDKSRQQLEEGLKNSKKKLEIKQKHGPAMPVAEALPGGALQPPLLAMEPTAKPRVSAAEIAQINNELRHAEVNYTLAVEGEKRVRERLAKVDAM